MTSVCEQDLIKLGEKYLIEAEIKRKEHMLVIKPLKTIQSIKNKHDKRRKNIIYKIERD